MKKRKNSNDLKKMIGNIDMSNISNIKSLERAVQEIFFNQQFIIQSLVADYSNY